jgi:hypothetical protein
MPLSVVLPSVGVYIAKIEIKIDTFQCGSGPNRENEVDPCGSGSSTLLRIRYLSFSNQKDFDAKCTVYTVELYMKRTVEVVCTKRNTLKLLFWLYI